MEKTLSIDEALENFNKTKDKLEEFIKEDINEADTRSKIIDNFLINVLGWSESDIKREGKVTSGFYDYKVSISGFHFIVEAKRNFIEFTIPKNHKTIKIKSFLKANENVITQIRDYADDYGVITNGKQFIILKLFNSDGTSWKENPCLIFGIAN